MSSIETIHGRPVSRFLDRDGGNATGFIWRMLARWFHASSTRRQLRELTDRELKDMGLTRETALKEAARPFWDTQFDAWHLR